MSLSIGRSGLSLRTCLHISWSRIFCSALIFLAASLAHAGVIRGTVTDTTGATVKGATIVLKNGAKYVATTVSTAVTAGSAATVKRQWSVAKAWLYRDMATRAVP